MVKIVNLTRPNTRAINYKFLTNGGINFEIPFKHAHISKNFFCVRAAKFWSDLPVNVKKAPNIAIFKKRLGFFLLNHWPRQGFLS